MSLQHMCAAAILAMPLWSQASAPTQQPAQPAGPKTTYSFPIRRGAAPLRFEVGVDPTHTVTGVAVYRGTEAKPFQTLPVCANIVTSALAADDRDSLLIEHSDLNFDGFEDLQLLQFRNREVGTRLYCIYTWDNPAGRFRPAPEIPYVNPVPHPESKTITVHQAWPGGLYADSTYRWNAASLQLIEERGRIAGSDDAKCSFTDHCDKVAGGKMVTTLRRAAGCSDGRPEPPLACPAKP